MRVPKPILVFAALALVAPISYYQATAQKDFKTAEDIMTASASWTIEEDASFTMVFLFVTKSDAGVDVFVSKDTFDTSLSGHLLAEDNSIFEIDRNLDSAQLRQVSVDVCEIGQKDENGECTEVVETIRIGAEWTSVDPKATSYVKDATISSSSMEMFMFHSSQKMASASGSLNNASLGEDLFAIIGKVRSIEFNYGPPSKTPTLAEGGNKGFMAANAFWSDATVDGQPAIVSLRVTEQIRGQTTVEVQIGIDSDDDGFAEFLQGEIIIPKDNDVFTMDMREATAELTPVAVTVCDIELASQCEDSPSAANYTIEAAWDGIEGSAIASRLTIRESFGDSKSSSDTDAVSMSADASGSIGGSDLGDSSSAFLFHFSTSKIQFK